MNSFPSRRQTLLILAGAGAATAGAVLAQKRAAPAALSPEAQAFWPVVFPQIGGSDLAAASLRGRPLLVNFWATWCPPCIKELPEINQFFKEAKDAKAGGWQVVGIAVDSAAPVQAFLQKLPLDFPVALIGPAGTALVAKLGNAPGGLPFSVAFDASGEIIWRRLGPTSLDELRKLAKAQQGKR